MLIGIQGGLGTGKTIMLVRYLLQDYTNGYPIVSNFDLKNINYTPFDVHDFLKKNNNKIELKNCTIGIDELTVYVDCRLSGSKKNVFFSYLVMQSRKRSVDLYYITQDFGTIDKRVNHHTHIKILCSKLFDENGDEIDHIRHYSIIDLRDVGNIRTHRFDMNISPYYNEYDTDEIIEPEYDNQKD